MYCGMWYVYIYDILDEYQYSECIVECGMWPKAPLPTARISG